MNRLITTLSMAMALSEAAELASNYRGANSSNSNYVKNQLVSDNTTTNLTE